MVSAAQAAALLRDGAKDPRSLLSAASIYDPGAVELSTEIQTLVNKHLTSPGASQSSTLLLVASTIGWMHGCLIDSRKEGATAIADAFNEQLTAVLKFACDEGFAEQLKEMKRAAD